MKYRIYLDVFFATNFIMDYLVIAVITAIPGFNCRKIEKIAAAIVGAMWPCIVIVLRLWHPIWSVLSYIIICLLMTIIVAPKKSIWLVVKEAVLMYFVICILGGLFLLVDEVAHFRSLWLLGTVGILGVGFARDGMQRVSSRLQTGINKGVATITHKGKCVRVNFLYDTGNSLVDPFTNKPVCVVEARAVNKLDYTKDSFYHLIPYKSLGKQDGVIPVVRFESMTLCIGSRKITVDEPYFALYSGEFSKGNEYRAIIHPKMIRS